MRACGELPEAVGDFGDKTVMQVACQYEYWFAERVPEFYHLLSFLWESGPRIMLAAPVVRAGSTYIDYVRDYEIDGRDHKQEIGVTVAHSFFQPGFLTSAEHRLARPVGLGLNGHLSMTAGIEDEEIAVGNAHLEITETTYGIADFAVGSRGWPDTQPILSKHFGYFIYSGSRVAAYAIEAFFLSSGRRPTPVHVQIAYLVQV